MFEVDLLKALDTTLSETYAQPVAVTQSMTRPFPLLVPHMTDRQFVHALIMKALPDDLSPDQPRADAQALWSWDALSGLLTVQSGRPLRHELLGELQEERAVEAPEIGQALLLEADLAALKTPPSAVPAEIRPLLKAQGGAYRSRQIVVPPVDRPGWVSRRLERAGFTAPADAITLSDVTIADLGRRGGGIPFVHVEATVQVHDADAAHQSLIRGVGKGKNFGLGLLRLSPLPTQSTTSPAEPKEIPA